MTLVAIYSRFSSHMQRDASIEDQLRLCREHAQRSGWKIVEEFADRAVSGASMLRPGLQQLLTAAHEGRFSVVLAEALDRLSRDQADVAAIYKRLTFSGVQIVTLAEGEIEELHVGLKGTMNQLFLKDLAAKTRRGLRGRVEAGKTGGGICYGYRVVRGLNANGKPITGEREIDDLEAEVVRRIFREFAAGKSPKAIARGLNAEGISGPRGLWRDTAIRGHRRRGTGILNNELYVGRLVWNRLRYIKDPSSGRRVSRANDAADWTVTQVPELRIVDDDLWSRVKSRQQEIDALPSVQGIKNSRFWEKRRRSTLLSGLVRCAHCGGTFARVGKDYMACSAARKLGTCTARRAVRAGVLEEAVMDLLQHRLMEPDAVAQFVKSYGAALNANANDETARRERLAANRKALARKLEGLYDAVADGLRTAGLAARLEELETQISAIDQELLVPSPTAVRLHPNIAELYREKVARLAQTLAEPEIREEALGVIRGLIDRVTIRFSSEGTIVELEGALTAMLDLAQNAKRPAKTGLYALSDPSSAKVVAGAGFEPATFRL